MVSTGQTKDLIEQGYKDAKEQLEKAVEAHGRAPLLAHLKNRSRKPLYTLVQSQSIWNRRIAIISTFHFIKNDEFDQTLKIAEILLGDTEDLIHKAVGWMLREVGKRDRNKEEEFLKKHYQYMPRTMLRYAIERFPENLRQQYLKGNI